MFLEKLFANSLRVFFKKFKALIPNANLYYANEILSKNFEMEAVAGGCIYAR